MFYNFTEWKRGFPVSFMQNNTAATAIFAALRRRSVIRLAVIHLPSYCMITGTL